MMTTVEHMAAQMLELKAGAVDLKIRRLDARATLPTYQTGGAAGMDLSACLPEGVEAVELVPVSKGGRIELIRLGFAMALPVGFEGQVRPRSGLSTRHGVTLPNAPGTIDCDYRGEVMVPLVNLGQEVFRVTHGMRIAQLVVCPVPRVAVREVAELDDTVRGSGGFGSTGR